MKNLFLFAIGVVDMGMVVFIKDERWVPVIIVSGLFSVYYSVWLESRERKAVAEHKRELVAAAQMIESIQSELEIASDAFSQMSLDYNLMCIQLNGKENELKAERHKVDMQAIMNESGLVSDAKFGKARGFAAPLHKAKEELDEAIESGKIEEFADVLICVLDAARKKGYNMKMLFRACYQKINVIWNRDYKPLNELGITSHIKRGDEKTGANGNEPPKTNGNAQPEK